MSSSVHQEFKKIKKIGEGTYGVVYKALEISTNRFVALKRMRIEADSGEGLPSTAIREIALLKQLKHKNIVELERVMFYKNQIYLVFEYCTNDLKKHMDKYKNTFSIRQIKWYMYQMLVALKFCHQSRIMHRDLKPQNILINEETGVIKLADFGLARTYNLPQKTWTHEVVTLWYRPPEILLGCKKYGTEVDIWSVACIFGELCNGSPLFVGDSQICQLMHIFKLMGTPSVESWPGVELLSDFKNSFPKWPGKSIQKIIPTMNELGIDLIGRLLVMNPRKRIIAKQALLHPFFYGLSEKYSNQ